MSAVDRLRAAAQDAVDTLARKEAIGREFDAMPNNSAIGSEWEAARDAWLVATDNEVCDALAAAVLALLDAPDLAEEGWAYASDYFRDRWEYAERMAEMRRALADAAAMLPGEVAE